MCEAMVYAMTRKDGSDVLIKCGEYFSGQGKLLCSTCENKAKARWPQGWRYYPGDTCKHGTYVGGCMCDLMCGACESGE
jgi:hypothetical protein